MCFGSSFPYYLSHNSHKMIYSESELELYLIFSTCYHSPAHLPSRSILKKKKQKQKQKQTKKHTQVEDSFYTQVMAEKDVLKWEAVS